MNFKKIRKELQKNVFIMKNNNIDKVTVDNLDIALRMVGVTLDRHLIDKIIDLVELIEDKGNQVTIKDVIELKEEWLKHFKFNQKNRDGRF